MENTVTKEMLSELKDMCDFIINSGYEIRTYNFRTITFHGASGYVFSNKAESLEHSLKNIVIYKEDPIDNIYKYISEKVENLKELMSIKDGSIFAKENVELFNYIESKSE